jgi:RNA polymerase sigma factor (sigma-70 family)
MMTETQELLANYLKDGSEPAFRELVSRYLDLVYSTAVRLVDGDAHRAEDVAQMVFADLARLAGKLPGSTMLGGWLHRHTCFVARTVMRGERRRQAREKKALEMNALNDNSDSVLARIAPILDEAIQELGADDRDAILLRFYERRNLRSVGEALGINENVAQKRVSRAVQELGVLLQRRGVSLSAAALATGLAAGAVTAAPTGLALSIAGTICAKAGTAGAGAGLTSAKVAAVAKLKVALVSALVVAGVMTTIFLHHQSKGTSMGETPAAQPPPDDPAPEAQPDPTPADQDLSASAPNTAPRPARPEPRKVAKPATAPARQPVRQSVALSDPNTDPTVAPRSWRLAAMSGSKVRIEGTSSLGDWQVESPLIGGFLEVGPGFPLEIGEAPQPGPVQAQAEAFIMVGSLKSVDKNGRPYSDRMDQVMYETLRERQNRKIFYHLSDLFLKGATNLNDALLYEFESQGELVVAGTTNPITMPVFVLPLDRGRFKVSGAIALKMTSFGIDPPALSAAMGPLKAGDDVRLLFEWVVGAREVPSTLDQKGIVVPLILELPPAVFKGTPKDLPTGPNVEPLSDKPRPLMLVPPALKNIAPSSKITSSDPNVPAGALAKLTDGDKRAADQSIIFLRKGTQWVQMDLGGPHEIFAIALWHAHNTAKIYHDVIVQVADDPGFTRNVRTLFNNDKDNTSKLGIGFNREYVETCEGKLINARGVKARSLRFYSKGSTESAINEYTEVEIYGRGAR